MKWIDKWVSVEFHTYWNAEYGLAQHKTGEKHMTIKEVCDLIDNKDAILNNKKMLAGLSGVMVEEWNGKWYVFQLCGYNGNIGMYCCLVDTDGKLHRG